VVVAKGRRGSDHHRRCRRGAIYGGHGGRLTCGPRLAAGISDGNRRFVDATQSNCGVNGRVHTKEFGDERLRSEAVAHARLINPFPHTVNPRGKRGASYAGALRIG